MAIGIKKCKVCGKEYEACHSIRPNLENEFRWRDVACCEEHGAEYLRQILAARGQKTAEPEPVQEQASEVAADAPVKKKTRRRRAGAEAEAGSKEMA